MTKYFEKYNWTALTVMLASRAVSETGASACGYGEQDKYQLGIKLTGKTDVFYNGVTYPYHSGMLLYLPKERRDKIIYRRNMIEGGCGAFVFFDSFYSLPPEPFIKPLNNPRKIYAGFCKLANLYHRGITRRLELMAAFYELLAALRDDAPPLGARTRLMQAKAYLDTHFSEEYIDFSIPAAMANMSVGYFRHCFADAYGQPPLQYVLQRRLDRASQLLAEGRSVSESAMQSGFADPNYFSRFFQARTGLSPTEFIKQKLC